MRARRPGTPAAIGEARLDDVIVGIKRAKGDIVKVKNADEFEAVRAKTRPGAGYLARHRPRWRHPATRWLPNSSAGRSRSCGRKSKTSQMRSGTVPPGFVDPPSFLTSMATLWRRCRLTGNRRPSGSASGWNKGNWEITAHDEKSVTFERPIPAQKLEAHQALHARARPPGSRQRRELSPATICSSTSKFRTPATRNTIGRLPPRRPDGPAARRLVVHPQDQPALVQRRRPARRGRPLRRPDGTARSTARRLPRTKPNRWARAQPLAFVGVDAVYFSAVMIPVKKSLDEDWFDTTEAIRIGPKPEATDARFASPTSLAA